MSSSGSGIREENLLYELWVCIDCLETLIVFRDRSEEVRTKRNKNHEKHKKIDTLSQPTLSLPYVAGLKVDFPPRRAKHAALCCR